MKFIKLRCKKYLGKRAIIDDEDFERVSKFSWYVLDNNKKGKSFYAVKWDQPKLLHRFVLNLVDPTQHVDHKNGNGLDCRKNNLRFATRQQNSFNRRFTKNKTGYMGVYKIRNKYQASIRIDGRNKSIGYFSTAKAASKAREKKSKEIFGEFYKPK